MIESHNEVIREIIFKKGVNLIVDETPWGENASGNNVGKTTVLRLIDFCLGGEGKNIYRDPEFKDKRNNTLIENFLEEKEVLITLILKEDLEIESSHEIIIKRNFLSRKEKIQEIDGESLSNEDFPKKLKELIFKQAEDKPSFRQIISKNIRDEKNRLQNTVKVLHPSTRQEDYEALYFFWLGIPTDDSQRKQQLHLQLKTEEGLQRRLASEGKLPQINQALLVVNRNIESLERDKQKFALNANYESDLAELNRIKSEINRISEQVTRLKLRKELILESQKELKSEYSPINPSHIKSLYQEAKIFIPDLQRTFEETLNFHNQMLVEKSRFIEKEIPNLELEIRGCEEYLQSLLLNEKEYSETLKKIGFVEELENIIAKLNEAYERKGGLDEKKRIWENTINKQESIVRELKDINQGISSKEHLLDQRIAKFNEYFSNISNELYGEQFILSHDKNPKGYELNISAITGNPGTGKKKVEIAAFDLAYILFADAMGIDCLHFILHDQMESIHNNEISTLLMNIVQKVNCQFVLPVLRDKLPKEMAIEEYEILRLSQLSKLFKIQ